MARKKSNGKSGSIQLGPDRPLRVLTMNIWGFFKPYATRQKLLREGIRALDPDLMVFEEAGYDGRRHQVAELLEGGGYHIIHQMDGVEKPPVENAVCIASRFPMRLLEHLSLQLTPRTLGYPYGALAARVEAPDPVGSFLFVGAKPSWELHCEREREVQAVAVARMIERLRDPKAFPTVLAGDFDATPDAASVRFLKGKQSLDGMSVHYRDAWEHAGDGTDGFTWTSENPSVQWIVDLCIHQPRHARRIDYIFLGSPHDYAKFAQFRTCRVVLNEPTRGLYPSDHYAVYAEIDVAARQM